MTSNSAGGAENEYLDENPSFLCRLSRAIAMPNPIPPLLRARFIRSIEHVENIRQLFG
jgi:hypothetical protein